MFNPEDSIDGLELTFDHLSADGKLVAIFRKLGRQLTDAERTAMATGLDATKKSFDKSQKRLAEAISTKARETR